MIKEVPPHTLLYFMIVLRCAFINARYVLLIILTGGKKVCTCVCIRDFPICYFRLRKKGVPSLIKVCKSVTHLIIEIKKNTQRQILLVYLK